jgi:uncharacterized protein YjdB
MTLPKDLVSPDYNYTYPSERPYFDETGSTLAAGRVADPAKSGADYGITDPRVTEIEIPVTGVTVSPSTASIAVGATKQLTPTVAPANASIKSVTYSSSATAKATVSASGLITGVAAGEATITVTTVDGAKTATCVVTVTEPSGG